MSEIFKEESEGNNINTDEKLEKEQINDMLKNV